MAVIKITEGQLRTIVNNSVLDNVLTSFEAKYRVSLSDNGKKWFMGLVNGTPFGVSEDDILQKVVFLAMNMEPVPIGRNINNEWDEMDGILRIVIDKTGYGNEILQRLRAVKKNTDFSITKEEWVELETKLQFYPSILEELKRCYHVFSEIAPSIYEKANILKNYKDGLPALEFCFLVGCVKEKERMRLSDAVSKVFFSSGKNLLPM